jgi:tetratricopeptide (TPR) repeat protein
MRMLSFSRQCLWISAALLVAAPTWATDTSGSADSKTATPTKTDGAQAKKDDATTSKSDSKTDSGKSDVSSEQANLLYMQGREKELDGKYEDAAALMEQAVKADPENPFINHQLSEIYLHLSNFDRAEALGRKAVDKDPKNIEYRATLGGIYASEKKYNEAKEQYNKILEIEPDNQKAPLLLGILEAENGQMEAGVKILSKAIDDSSDNVMALFYRAKIYLEMDQVDRAKADLDRCLTLRPSFIEAGSALGLLQEKLGETDNAIKTYVRIQGTGRFKKRLAQLYLQKNEYDKALTELLDYERVEPDDYTARVKIGLIYFELKKYSDALERFNSILKEQPDADNIRFYVGAIREDMKQYDQAMTEFKKVSKDSSFYKEAMLHIGFLYREQDKLSEGLEYARKLLKQAPDIVEFYDMCASFYEAKREYSKALAVINDGLARNAATPDEKLLYFQGALYDKMGDRSKSIESMKKILVTNPNNAHALNFLGYTYADAGEKLDEAEKMIRRALELRPTDGYIEDSLGWVLYKQGKTDEALEHLNKAVTLQADEPVIFEHLGDIFAAQKRTDKALENYKKAVSLTDKKDTDSAKKLETKIASLGTHERVPTTAADAPAATAAPSAAPTQAAK